MKVSQNVDYIPSRSNFGRYLLEGFLSKLVTSPMTSVTVRTILSRTEKKDKEVSLLGKKRKVRRYTDKIIYSRTQSSLM